MMTPERRREMLSSEADALTVLIREAMREAVEEHYRAGNPVAIWRDGMIVEVPAEEIPSLLASSDDGAAADHLLPLGSSVEQPISGPNRSSPWL